MCGVGAALLLSSAASALADVHYVDVNSTNATPPYTNWATATTNIQDAVDAAVAGDEIVVTNGDFADWSDRDGYAVKVDKPISIRSINGPQVTSIASLAFSGGCVCLTNNASLSGFTLADGWTSVWGSGAYGGTLNNCTLLNNYTDTDGGGAAFCTLNNCTLSHNNAHGSGGGAYYCTLNNCTLTLNSAQYGGGAYNCRLNNCTLTGNSAQSSNGTGSFGGGAYACMLNNCTLTSNSVSGSGPVSFVFGGGAYHCTLTNCTLTGNSARGSFGFIAAGGGADASTLYNCIVYFNSASFRSPNCDGCNLDYCCTTPDPGGFGNITNAPLFVDQASGNLRMQSNSPCINAGLNAFAPAGPDLDGNPRIAGGTVDIGAYEFQAPTSMISYAWLQAFNLSIDGSADYADPDGDAVDNYHEWLAGTDPTNRFSSPAQLTITPSGVPPSGIILSWFTNAVGFVLQSSTNLLSPAAWVTNSPAPVVIGGQNVVTNPLSGPQQFFRLSQ